MSNPRITGAIRYAQDVELDGMLHARILRSPYPHARIVRIDTSALPGDVVVLTPDDVRGLGTYGCQIKDQTVLPLDRARYAGDPVAAVAAPTRQQASEALDLIDVEYEELPAIFDAVEAASEGAVLVHDQHTISDNDAAYFGMRPQPGTNICHRFRIHHGNIDEGFAQADVIVEETYHTASAQHAPMEPHASLAHWVGDRLEVYSGTQTPFNVRMDLAGIFGLPESQASRENCARTERGMAHTQSTPGDHPCQDRRAP
jgi:CO/xanthine dehydrogenase Mo-binding subunit